MTDTNKFLPRPEKEMVIEFEDGGLMKLQWVEGKLSVHLQAFHPGGLRKATGTTVLVEEQKTIDIIEWLAASSYVQARQLETGEESLNELDQG